MPRVRRPTTLLVLLGRDRANVALLVVGVASLGALARTVAARMATA